MIPRTGPYLAMVLLGCGAAGCAMESRTVVAPPSTPIEVGASASYDVQPTPAGAPLEVTGSAEASVVLAEPAPQTVIFREPPPLAEIESNVYVVESSSYPIYYVDGLYWYAHGGTWYQTRYWDQPWVTVQVGVVPPLIVHRRHDHYVNYRSTSREAVWREPRSASRGQDRAQAVREARERVEALRRRSERGIERDADRDRSNTRARSSDRERPTTDAAPRRVETPPVRRHVEAPSPPKVAPRSEPTRPAPPPRTRGKLYDDDDRPTPPKAKDDRRKVPEVKKLPAPVPKRAPRRD